MNSEQDSLVPEKTSCGRCENCHCGENQTAKETEPVIRAVHATPSPFFPSSAMSAVNDTDDGPSPASSEDS